MNKKNTDFNKNYNNSKRIIKMPIKIKQIQKDNQTIKIKKLKS